MSGNPEIKKTVDGALLREFYLQDANTVAASLLGKLLVHKSKEGTTSGMIVETEAYLGWCDKGAHSYPNKRTARTSVQFGDGGHAYVYLIYGMYSCFNVVTNKVDVPEAVLIRALEPIEGIELMRARRPKTRDERLCSGPGCLCSAMAITRELYGCDLCGNELYILPFSDVKKEDIMVSPRINIDYAKECKDYMWRYFIKDNRYVSKVAKRYDDKKKEYAIL